MRHWSSKFLFLALIFFALTYGGVYGGGEGDGEGGGMDWVYKTRCPEMNWHISKDQNWTEQGKLFNQFNLWLPSQS